jgi:hypothetical protein
LVCLFDLHAGAVVSAAPEVILERMLKEHQFRVVRQDRHKIYKNPDNRIFVTSSTPSDAYRWAHNAIACLKRVLAAPPRSEILSIQDCKEAEDAIRLQKQEKAKPGIVGIGGKGSGSSGGTGVVYYGPNDEAPKRLSKKERRLKKERENAAAAERERLRILAENNNREEESRARREKYEKRCQEEARIEAARLAKWEAERPARELAQALAVALNRNNKFLLHDVFYDHLDDFKEYFNAENVKVEIWISENFENLVKAYVNTENPPCDEPTDWILDENGEIDIPANAILSFNARAKITEEVRLQDFNETKFDPNFATRVKEYLDCNDRIATEDYDKAFQKFRSIAKTMRSNDVNELSDADRAKIASACEDDELFIERVIEQFAKWAKYMKRRRKAMEADFPNAETRLIDYYRVFDRAEELAKIVDEHNFEGCCDSRQELSELVAKHPHLLKAARFEFTWSAFNCHCGLLMRDSIVNLVLTPCGDCGCLDVLTCGWSPDESVEAEAVEASAATATA